MIGVLSFKLPNYNNAFVNVGTPDGSVHLKNGEGNYTTNYIIKRDSIFKDPYSTRDAVSLMPGTSSLSAFFAEGDNCFIDGNYDLIITANNKTKPLVTSIKQQLSTCIEFGIYDLQGNYATADRVDIQIKRTKSYNLPY